MHKYCWTAREHLAPLESTERKVYVAPAPLTRCEPYNTRTLNATPSTVVVCYRACCWILI